jgi:hypothetical protein
MGGASVDSELQLLALRAQREPREPWGRAVIRDLTPFQPHYIPALAHLFTFLTKVSLSTRLFCQVSPGLCGEVRTWMTGMIKSDPLG